MAEGLYPRPSTAISGVCIGTSGPGRTDMITGLLGIRRIHPDPLHHRAGAACASRQGGFPGGRHRKKRGAGHQMGGHRMEPALVPFGLPEGPSI